MAIFLVTLVLALVLGGLTEEVHDYCILGAGPGGLQVGHLMLQRGWDYITLERNDVGGSFFDR